MNFNNFGQNRQLINFVSNRINELCESVLNIRNNRINKLSKFVLIFSLFTLFPMLFVLSFGKISSETFIYGMGVFIFSIYIMFKIITLGIQIGDEEGLRRFIVNSVMIISRYFAIITNETDNGRIRMNRIDLMFMNFIHNLQNHMNLDNEKLQFWETRIQNVINGQDYIQYIQENRPIDSITQEEINDEFFYTIDNCLNDFVSETTIRRMYHYNSPNFTIKNPFTNLNLERIIKWKFIEIHQN